jgi:hypothetical protein
MAAPVQRRAIEGERQYFTLRQTFRAVPMKFPTLSNTRPAVAEARRQGE